MKKLITILFLFACSFAYAQSLPNVAFPTSEAVADTYTVNITNYGASYNDKVALINFRTPNGGPATLNITPSGGSALGARPLRKFDGSDWVPLASGDLRGDSSLYLVHYSSNCGCLRIVPQGTGSASIPDLDQVLTQGSTANIANLFAVTSTSGGFNIQSNESGVSSSVIGTTVETTLEWDNGVNYGNLTMDVNGNRFTGSETFSFAPTATESGLNVGSVAGDPSSPENGDLWYDQTANELTARINGANVALGAGGGGDIEIGTTNVTGGTNTRVLYNNSGVAGEYAISGTGNVAMTSYVDDNIATFKWKQSVRVSTTTNGTLATAFENGDAIDGITLATGDRILINNQSTTSDNGIYIVAASGAPTRATDADAAVELEGAVVLVQDGTTQRNTIFIQVTDGITLGSSGIIFIREQPFVTPEMFGAVGDGSTNDQPAFDLAFASGYAVHGDRTKNYRFTTAVTLPDNAVFIGNGCTISVATLIHTFILGNNCTVDNVRFDGNDAGSTGINVSSVFRNKISNSYFTGYDAAGLFITQTAGASDYEGGIQVSNCYFESCDGRGVRAFTNAEYNNFTNCTSRGNTIANVTFGGGNNTWTGGKITDSPAIGFELVAGTNDGHGTIVGTSINHNATNVSAISVANGFEIIACDIIAGNITITTSNAINIRSSRIDGTVNIHC